MRSHHIRRAMNIWSSVVPAAPSSSSSPFVAAAPSPSCLITPMMIASSSTSSTQYNLKSTTSTLPSSSSSSMTAPSSFIASSSAPSSTSPRIAPMKADPFKQCIDEEKVDCHRERHRMMIRNQVDDVKVFGFVSAVSSKESEMKMKIAMMEASMATKVQSMLLPSTSTLASSTSSSSPSFKSSAIYHGALSHQPMNAPLPSSSSSFNQSSSSFPPSSFPPNSRIRQRQTPPHSSTTSPVPALMHPSSSSLVMRSSSPSMPPLMSSSSMYDQSLNDNRHTYGHRSISPQSMHPTSYSSSSASPAPYLSSFAAPQSSSSSSFHAPNHPSSFAPPSFAPSFVSSLPLIGTDASAYSTSSESTRPKRTTAAQRHKLHKKVKAQYAAAKRAAKDESKGNNSNNKGMMNGSSGYGTFTNNASNANDNRADQDRGNHYFDRMHRAAESRSRKALDESNELDRLHPHQRDAGGVVGGTNQFGALEGMIEPSEEEDSDDYDEDDVNGEKDTSDEKEDKKQRTADVSSCSAAVATHQSVVTSLPIDNNSMSDVNNYALSDDSDIEELSSFPASSIGYARAPRTKHDHHHPAPSSSSSSLFSSISSAPTSAAVAAAYSNVRWNTKAAQPGEAARHSASGNSASIGGLLSSLSSSVLAPISGVYAAPPNPALIHPSLAVASMAQPAPFSFVASFTPFSSGSSSSAASAAASRKRGYISAMSPSSSSSAPSSSSSSPSQLYTSFAAATSTRASASNKHSKAARKKALKLQRAHERIITAEQAASSYGGGGGGVHNNNNANGSSSSSSGGGALQTHREQQYAIKHGKHAPPQDLTPFSAMTHFVPEELRNMESDWKDVRHVIMLDIDNWTGFFKRISWKFNSDVYLWIFHGAKTTIKVPRTNPTFLHLRELKHIQFTKCGDRPDASDFALMLKLGELNQLCAKDIPFTLFSGDKGFDEALVHVSDRRVQRIDPHAAGTDEETFVMLRSITET